MPVEDLVAEEDMEEEVVVVVGLLLINNNRSLSKKQTSVPVLQEAMVAEDRVVVDMEVDLQLEETARVAKRFK